MTSILPKFPKHFASLRSDRFVLAIPDEEIDRLFPGEDCCSWFYERLTSATACVPYQSPLMEDWGWTFAVQENGSTIRVNIWGIEKWIFAIESERSLMAMLIPSRRKKTEDARLAICGKIESIIRNDTQMEFLGWSEAFPG